MYCEPIDKSKRSFGTRADIKDVQVYGESAAISNTCLPDDPATKNASTIPPPSSLVIDEKASEVVKGEFNFERMFSKLMVSEEGAKGGYKKSSFSRDAVNRSQARTGRSRVNEEQDVISISTEGQRPYRGRCRWGDRGNRGGDRGRGGIEREMEIE